MEPRNTVDRIRLWRQQHAGYGYDTEIVQQNDKFVVVRARVYDLSNHVKATGHALVSLTEGIESPLEHAEDEAIRRAIAGFPDRQPEQGNAKPEANGKAETNGNIKQLADQFGMTTGDQIKPKEADIDNETVDRLRGFSERLSSAWTLETLKAIRADLEEAGPEFLKAMEEQGKTAKERVLLARKDAGEWSDADMELLIAAVEKAHDLDDFTLWAKDRTPEMDTATSKQFCDAESRWRKKHGKR